MAVLVFITFLKPGLICYWFVHCGLWIVSSPLYQMWSHQRELLLKDSLSKQQRLAHWNRSLINEGAAIPMFIGLINIIQNQPKQLLFFAAVVNFALLPVFLRGQDSAWEIIFGLLAWIAAVSIKPWSTQNSQMRRLLCSFHEHLKSSLGGDCGCVKMQVY